MKSSKKLKTKFQKNKLPLSKCKKLKGGNGVPNPNPNQPNNIGNVDETVI